MTDLPSSLVKYQLGMHLILQTDDFSDTWLEWSSWLVFISAYSRLSSVIVLPSVLVFCLSDAKVARVSFLRVDVRNSSRSFQRWSFGQLTILQLDFWYIGIELQVLSARSTLEWTKILIENGMCPPYTWYRGCLHWNFSFSLCPRVILLTAFSINLDYYHLTMITWECLG